MSRKLGDSFIKFEQTEPPIEEPGGKVVNEKYKEKLQKEKVEDTHDRTTFLIRKDLKKRLDKLSKNKRGYKTLFINEAIERLLEIEEGK